MLCVCNVESYHIIDAPEDHSHPKGEDHHDAQPDRCKGIEFDAITPDEKGNTFFFKGLQTLLLLQNLRFFRFIFITTRKGVFVFLHSGDHLWKGFTGPAELSGGTFKELDENHHLGHVDAAFRMHHGDDPSTHDHIFFFLVLTF